MNAGRLDKRITIERMESGQDELGQPIEGWIPTYSVWASIEPLQGREYIAAMAAQAERTVRIRLRYLRAGPVQLDRESTVISGALRCRVIHGAAAR